jgi:hypothetical protein
MEFHRANPLDGGDALRSHQADVLPLRSEYLRQHRAYRLEGNRAGAEVYKNIAFTGFRLESAARLDVAQKLPYIAHI